MKVASWVLALIATSSMTGLAADSPDVSGTWQIHSSIAGTENDSKCTLKEDGAKLTGTCTTAEGKDAETSGTIDGTKVVWSFKSEYQGTPLTVNYDGTVDADKISGTVSVPEFSVTGDFTATLQK